MAATPTLKGTADNDTMTTNTRNSPKASSQLTAIITIPLSVVLIILLITICCALYHWKIRGGANHWRFCAINCCSDRGGEGADEQSDDIVTPEAIITQGRTVRTTKVL